MAGILEPNLGLYYGWALGEGGWNTGVDSNFKRLGALIDAAVINMTVTTGTLPGSPTNGDRYIIGSGVNANSLVIRIAGAWQYYVPQVGMCVWNIAEPTKLYVWTGTAWVNLITGSGGTGITDGDKGDITVSSSGAVWSIDNGVVTFAKIQNFSTASLLFGRGAGAGAGVGQPISLGTNLSMSGTTLNATGGGGGGDALTANPLSQFAPTTSAQLASVLTDGVGASGGFMRSGASLANLTTRSASDLSSGSLPDARLPDVVSPGSATHASVTVDAKGRVTALASGVAGAGDVIGPASSINNRIMVSDGTDGKHIKDGGSTIADIIAGAGGVASFSGRTGAVSPATNDYTWAQVNKTTSSLADIATRSAADLTSGILLDARFPGGASIVHDVSYASLSAAVTALGSTPATLRITTALYPNGANVSIPVTLILEFIGAGTLTLTTGQTVTILSDTSNWPNRQLFVNALASQGTISFAGNKTAPTVIPQWWGVDSTGATDAGAVIERARVAAETAESKHQHLPAGTYLVGSSAFTNIFAVSQDNVEISGDGQGKTIIKFPSSVAPNANATIFYFTGANQKIHGITFRGSDSVSNATNYTAISIGLGAYNTEVFDNEFTNINGDATAGQAGASAIGLYQPYNQPELTTTLGTTIAAGTRTVTPASMLKIYVGRLLTIGGSAENVLVTAITSTTFTAVFANAHNSTDAVTGSANGLQRANVHDNYIHDCYQATGILPTSSGNTFRHNIIIRVGATQNQHGFYIQGGNNTFIDNWVEGVGGFSFHQHTSTSQTIDSSNNKYIGNTSLNPGVQHFLADTASSNGTNPYVPSGTNMGRQVSITGGNVFRTTRTGANAVRGVVLNGVSAAIEGNTFEDTSGAGGDYYVDASAATNVTVSNNEFRRMNAANSSAIYLSTHSQATGNRIINWSGNYAIRVGDNCIVKSNDIQGDFDSALYIGGDNVEVADNNITAASGFVLRITGNNFNIHDNIFNPSGVQSALAYTTYKTGAFHDNVSLTAALWKLTQTGKDLVIYNNAMAFQWLTRTGLQTKREMGSLLYLDVVNSPAAIVVRKLVKLDTSGAAALCGTADTNFVGIAVMGTSGGDTAAAGSAQGLFVAGQPGTVFDGVTTDGAWTIGNVGIVSATTAGTIHDNGTQIPPANGSYVVFLDSGGSAGNARVLVGRTFVTPSTPLSLSLAADVNNYALITAGQFTVEMTATGATRNITGIVAGTNGERHLIINVSANDVVLQHQSASSTAANRIISNTGADLALAQYQSATIYYSTSQTRWIIE